MCIRDSHIAIVGKQTFGTGQSLFVRKRELKNTFFKFPVIYNTDVFDADMVPVSYTHLDVYKRQPSTSMIRSCCVHRLHRFRCV